MPRYVISLFVLLFVAVQMASANIYTFGSKQNPATTEITPQGKDLLITCTFKEQTKFKKDKNARFNRAKADSYCQQGLLMYFGSQVGNSISLNGIAVEKSPMRSNGQITYFFRMVDASEKALVQHATENPATQDTVLPVIQSQPAQSSTPQQNTATASVQEAPAASSEPQQNAPAVAAKEPPVATSAPQQNAPAVAAKEPPVAPSAPQQNAPAVAAQEPPVATSAPQQNAPAVAAQEPPVATPMPQPEVAVARVQEQQPVAKKKSKPTVKTSSKLLVVRYTRGNGQLNILEEKTFQSSSFKNEKEFDDFCDKMFRDINQKGIENQNAVRDIFKKEKARLLNLQ